MSLKPQDVLVALKLAVLGEQPATFKELGDSLGMSASEVHAACGRAVHAGFVDGRRHVISANLLEFLIHGVRYAFRAEHGRMTRGMPTAHAAPPLAQRLGLSDGPPPVWPDPEGSVRGEEFAPLYKSVPKAAKQDPALYELLTLVDALRDGRARERKIAAEELKKRLAS